MKKIIGTICIVFNVLTLIGITEPSQNNSELQWPWWRGPYSNGRGVSLGKSLGDRPKLLWHSTEFTKRTGGSCTYHPLWGGCQSLIMHDNRIYVSFYVGSQEPVVYPKSKNGSIDGEQFEKDPSAYAEKLRNNKRDNLLDELPRVGLPTDTPDGLRRILRMALNIYADDMMVCLDAETGKTLWKDAVPGGVNITGATYGGHLTPSVDPTTGRVYAVGTTGRVICWDGKTGKRLWIAEPPEDKKASLGKAMLEKHVANKILPYFLRGRYEITVAVDGVVVCRGEAYDGATGKLLWIMPAHWLWLPWQYEGKWYLINSATRCVDPHTGKDLWNLPKEEVAATVTGDEGCAIAIEGNLMFAGNAAYRISPKGRELIWRNEDIVNTTPGVAIRNGRIYMVGYRPDEVRKAREAGQKLSKVKAIREDVLEIDLATGKIIYDWHGCGPWAQSGPTPVIMDNRLFIGGNGPDQHAWIDLDQPDAVKLIDENGNKIKRDTFSSVISRLFGVQTPVAYKGRMYFRADWSVACVTFRDGEGKVVTNAKQNISEDDDN